MRMDVEGSKTQLGRASARKETGGKNVEEQPPIIILESENALAARDRSGDVSRILRGGF